MKKLKRAIYRFPGVRWLHSQYSTLKFPGSHSYWDDRYQKGGTSGAGSYGRLAELKAGTINAFVKENDVESIIEFGCGDCNQLTLAQYPLYTGLDVSSTAIEMCQNHFRNDATKSFFQYNPRAFLDNQGLLTADLALSLDVIYHLIEDSVFDLYMKHLFDAAERFVIVYSSNHDETRKTAHVRHRCFTDWVSGNADHWGLRNKIANKYPFDPKQPDDTSFADFYVFEKINVTQKNTADK